MYISYLAAFLSAPGGLHRANEPGQYEKTAEARENNRYLAQTYAIMRWAREKNPHLIVVIENPDALLKQMPLMHEMEQSFGLHRARVHYCALGRDDKKPTNIWTNVRRRSFVVHDGARCQLPISSISSPSFLLRILTGLSASYLTE